MARKRYMFWLDSDKEEEKQLMDTIAALKKQRKFASAIREGLQLQSTDRVTPPTNGGAGDDSLKHIEKMLELILTATKPNGGYEMQSTGGPKPLAAPTLAMPTFEDEDEPVLKLGKSQQPNAAQNFMASLSGIVH